jgi:hypothetical protein
MPATSFDFDVITGPSTPRDDRDTPPAPPPAPQPRETRPAPQPAE